MKTLLQKAAALCFFACHCLMSAQVDLTLGLNYSYNPPSNCNNMITDLEVDICNNGSSAAGAFVVGVYLYNSNTSDAWVIDQTTVSSLSGNACKTISNWDINMNNYCCLPPPANYKIGVWIDTAGVITETNENNNSYLISGLIQVCAKSTATGFAPLKQNEAAFEIYPNPAINNCHLKLDLQKQENIAVSVCDITGKEIFRSDIGIINSGIHEISISADNFEEGIYFVKVSVSGTVSTKKLVLQK